MAVLPSCLRRQPGCLGSKDCDAIAVTDSRRKSSSGRNHESFSKPSPRCTHQRRDGPKSTFLVRASPADQAQEFHPASSLAQVSPQAAAEQRVKLSALSQISGCTPRGL
jgi:hypothetical protein